MLECSQYMSTSIHRQNFRINIFPKISLHNTTHLTNTFRHSGVILWESLLKKGVPANMLIYDLFMVTGHKLAWLVHLRYCNSMRMANECGNM